MAITIKKSKLTLKGPVAESPVAPPTDAPAAGAAEAAPGKPRIAASGAPSFSIFQVVVLVFALLALSLFPALLILQAKESSYYSAPPSAFPEFAGGMAAPAATVAPASVAAPTKPRLSRSVFEAIASCQKAHPV